MGAFYGKKIRSKETNPRTGTAWKLEDVPSLWKEKTEDWLKNSK